MRNLTGVLPNFCCKASISYCICTRSLIHSWRMRAFCTRSLSSCAISFACCATCASQQTRRRGCFQFPRIMCRLCEKRAGQHDLTSSRRTFTRASACFCFLSARSSLRSASFRRLLNERALRIHTNVRKVDTQLFRVRLLVAYSFVAFVTLSRTPCRDFFSTSTCSVSSATCTRAHLC